MRCLLAHDSGLAGHLLLLPILAGAVGMAGWPGASNAATLEVAPGNGALQQAIGVASRGDTIELASGSYGGSLVIDKPMTLLGVPGTVIDGGGASRVITIDAPDVTLRDLKIRGSGALLESEDSGVFVTKKGDRALIEHNEIVDNLIGVYLKGPNGAVVRNNRIHGRNDLRLNERGNGIQLWNTPGSIIEGNEISSGRDGIFVTTSKRNVFRRNQIFGVRFAVHYMYTNDSEVSGNVSRGNDLGYAIMYSSRIRVTANRSVADRDHGILLNYANHSEISRNVVSGPDKCVFIYNANRNSFFRNKFQDCGIGVHFTAGSERNAISENAFVNNRTQVKYVGTRHIEWSVDSRGNYWSDNLAFDLNADGIADEPYKPNDIVDQIVWRHPAAKQLLTSPAFQVLRWAQSAFPAIYPGGVVDSAPLMQPVAVPAAQEP
jgi:nitrous oxidase accessory protein